MTTAAVRLTDPALEFSVLADKLRSFEPNNPTETYKVLAKFTGVEESNPRLFELLGCVGGRSVSLMEFISSTEDEFLDDATKKELGAIVFNISQVISPQNMSQQWNRICAQHLLHSQILSLRQFSQTARRYRPLRLVGEEEKKDVISKIDEAIADFKNMTGVPEWTMGLLRDGLRRLRFMIQYLEFFGHEAVLDHLMRVNGEAEAASKSLGEQGKEIARKVYKTAAVIATAIGILVAPVKAYEAYYDYKGYMLSIIEKPPALLAAPLKQLTGPKPPAAANSGGAGRAQDAEPPAP